MTDVLTADSPVSEAMQQALDDIIPKLESLAQALEVENPDMANYMMAIKEDLNAYPQLTYLLTDEQIAPIYMGLVKIENVQIKIKTAKKSKKNNVLSDGRNAGDLL